MSEKMIPIPQDELLAHVCEEYETNGTIFGVSHIWKSSDKTLPIFGETLETPFGPAAGPNTQLAQNIIAAYAAGARFFELKTVQIMDGEELAACINRPCISAADEGYNCEWSTELTVTQAMQEYIKAWNVLKIISEKYDLGSPDGFVFNMSVGYTLNGIKSEKITAFLDGMKNAGVSNSVTISTLHGCPPDEIERIANYLIAERGLHTYVKCNPTLLGYDFARETLDKLGYDYISFDDHHFREDLQWADAVPMFRRLTSLAAEHGVEFGLKLTNTFPVDVKNGELPSEEMYMSGRSLFPLTAELASRISKEFKGKLRISWAGGADAHNITALFRAGIWPVTMATNLLRPGGYNRMKQLAELLEKEDYRPFTCVDTNAAACIASGALTDSYYHKPLKPLPDRKNGQALPLTDCFIAPCRGGCPLEQDIPAYLRLCAEEKWLEALNMITERNPLPNITGKICAHPCMARCTRNFYEGAVDIRGCKLEATEKAYDEFLTQLKNTPPVANGKKVAVVGAGPAGLAAAYFLAKNGCDVTVFEKTKHAGGLVRRVIPAFRIATKNIEKDVALCEALGVKFRFGVEIHTRDELAEFETVILCVGADKHGELALTAGRATNAIDFLEAAKKHPHLTIPGRHVVIVGGGNTAIDAARVAKRCFGVKTVTVVYRRSLRDMPAEEEEIKLLAAEGIVLKTLLNPVSLNGHTLRCEKMILGEVGADGRRSVTGSNEYEELPANMVIAAVGERINTEFYRAFGLEIGTDGQPVYDPATGKTSSENVYIAGDGAGGPATIVRAEADAARAAAAVCGADFGKFATQNAGELLAAMEKKGVFPPENTTPAARCLECATVCETCVDVCPNRANVPIEINGNIQILHVDGMCNECGNCATFCPWAGAPYRDKWTLYWNRESFDKGPNQGFLPLDGERVLCRLGDEVFETNLQTETKLPEDLAVFTKTILTKFKHLLSPKTEPTEAERIKAAAEAYLPDMTAFLRDLIRLPSESCGEEGVVNRAVEEMKKLGYDEAYIDPQGNAIGLIGQGEKIIAFDGHIDTVGVGLASNWEFDPYEGFETDTTIGGRGGSDQEGGCVSQIYAAKIAADLGLIPEGYRLLVTCTVQEEDCDGLCWQYIYNEDGFRPEFVVSTEPTDGGIYRGHRGRMEIRVDVKGVSCHGSAPERGDNAIFKMADILRDVRALNENDAAEDTEIKGLVKMLDEKYNPAWEDANFLGRGTITVSEVFFTSPSRCAVADSCSVSLDRRMTAGETFESCLQEIRDLPACKKYAEDVTVSMYKYDRPSWTGLVYETECYFPTWINKESAPHVQAVAKAHKELYGDVRCGDPEAMSKRDGRPLIDKWTFSTNGVAIQGRAGIPCVGFGPGAESQAHAPNEITWKQDLVHCAAVLAATPKKYAEELNK